MANLSLPDVLICGAGAAGLTLAIDLARRGVAFRLIEKMPGPFLGSRGKGIQPRSQEVLEDLGILDRIVAIGGQYPVQREYRADGSYVESLITEPVAATPAEPYHIPLLVPQFLTEQVLRERLSELGQQVEFGLELRDFTQHPDGVSAQLVSAAGEEIVSARYLIGTDGGRSVVRHVLGLGFPGKTLGVRGLVADVMVAGVSREAWHRWSEGDMAQQIALCPLSGTKLFQLQAPVPLEGEIDISASGLTQMLRERTGCDDIMVQSVAWGSAYIMNARLADRYRVSRVFLAGDAAHTHPPTGAQGLNTSLQDAYNLGWKIAAVLGGAPDALLDSYEAERRPVAEHMLGMSTRLLDETKRGVNRRGREVQQLDIGYNGSALGLALPEQTGGLLPGDRASDAPLTGAAGQRIRMFEVMKGPHWTAIGYETKRGTGPTPRRNLHVHYVSAHGDLKDIDGHFAAAYGPVRGNWILIRPDGYIGAIVSGEHTSALSDYLLSMGLAENRANAMA